ncbi:MAG: hypothetical protein EOP49_11740 [Sphingobacteriales bacterium]|nr:MAG: hypothetical protein EOP49_11740 [Sphingobacteriales bacterium]
MAEKEINPEKKGPGLYATKPLFKTTNHLRKALGYFDTIPTTLEILIQDFEKRCQKEGVTPEAQISVSAHLVQKGFGAPPFDEFRQRVYDLYLINAYNIVDPYLSEMKAVVRKLRPGHEWKKSVDGTNLDTFGQLVINCSPDGELKLRAKPEYYLFDYYRYYRNKLVHGDMEAKRPLFPDQPGTEHFKKVEDYYNEHLIEHKAYFLANYQLAAPNLPRKIGIDDFFLYTRAIKYYSNLINDVWFDTIESGLVSAAATDPLLLKAYNGSRLGKGHKKYKPAKKWLLKYFHQGDIGQLDDYLETIVKSIEEGGV